jgi:hypothetical protein
MKNDIATEAVSATNTVKIKIKNLQSSVLSLCDLLDSIIDTLPLHREPYHDFIADIRQGSQL